MKKIISTLLLFGLLVLPMNSILASDSSPSFFEAIANFSQIEDYKVIQSFYGNVELEEFGDHVKVDYRLTVNSVVDSDTVSSFNRISAYFKFYNLNEVSDDTPFKEMTVQANGEMTTKDQNDLYFKLTNFNINLKDGLPFAELDIEGAKVIADLFKGTWFHVAANDLSGIGLTEFEESVEVEEYIEFQEQFKEEPQEAILGVSELFLSDSESGFSEDTVKEILEGIGLALETKLFTSRKVVSGRNTGFHFFNLNKGAIINFFKSFGELIDEELTDNDIREIRSALSKVSISGIYRTEAVYGIINNLLLRFRLKDVEIVKNLEMNYRYKLSDLNKENRIKTPSDYQEAGSGLTNF